MSTQTEAAADWRVKFSRNLHPDGREQSEVEMLDDEEQHSDHGFQQTDLLVSLENNRLKSSNNDLQTELSGINKTLWDEIKQLKNQIEVYEGKRCPDSWMRFGCSCYYKSTEKKTWNESRDFCQENGSDLVVVNSKEEQDFLSTLEPTSESWIGLFAEWSSDKSEWKWVDGSPLTETFWDERISENPYNVYAVTLCADRTWTQQNRGFNKNWICEKYITF
ncbi:C-type lectin domain family 17, member A-like isoform X2 [Oryzias latipes]|uniref:C-type lectin domain family 17, member A-like isoform X2 n=1 Tax=Oryzias latipes TaxID=8090 RepID=UPI000CE27FB7|nr:C-type lectin domain family 17, member A-like isoform X2 [Oryzias latipes]